MANKVEGEKVNIFEEMGMEIGNYSHASGEELRESYKEKIRKMRRGSEFQLFGEKPLWREEYEIDGPTGRLLVVRAELHNFLRSQPEIGQAQSNTIDPTPVSDFIDKLDQDRAVIGYYSWDLPIRAFGRNIKLGCNYSVTSGSQIYQPWLSIKWSFSGIVNRRPD